MATPTCPLQLRLYKIVRRAMVIDKYYFKAGMGQCYEFHLCHQQTIGQTFPLCLIIFASLLVSETLPFFSLTHYASFMIHCFY